MSKPFSWEAFNKVPVVGIMRNIPQAQVEMLVSQYHESGFTTLEVTMNSEGAAKTISYLSEIYTDNLNIGAGTVLTLEDLDEALKAGANFIVTPVVNEDVIKTCVARKVPVFPGAYTPTEIYKAWSMGASMVKVFPATRLGPDYIKEVLAPLNFLKLVPTGGVSIDTIIDFFKAGAAGVGMGSTLFPKNLVENEKWSELARHLSSIIKKYNQSMVNG
ncbi:MAG: bifunctional 4-hydroxy-2-oxoglutarate aldolase/2-dehydro-3-deoxy-phosphogluconate aldolase [Chitinophagaceae bacterium]